MHRCRAWTVFSASLLGVNGMLVARHFRRRLLIFSVSTLGFFISSFSAVLALDFTRPVVSVLDGDTIEVLYNHRPERIRLSGMSVF
jgi:endonuclease YncB( thermonuclease family)